MSTEILTGDCVEVMAAMAPNSVDAVVCDPPYGLEFMGKEWDAFRVDDPGTNRNRGERAGGQGLLVPVEDRHGRRANVSYCGSRPRTSRCVGCGKRDQYRNPHSCPPGTRWVSQLLDPYAAPPSMLAFGEWTRLWARAAYRVLKPGGHLLAFGGSRTYHRMACAVEDAGFEIRDQIMWLYGSGFPKSLDVSKAIDQAAGARRDPVTHEVVVEADLFRDEQRGEVVATKPWENSAHHFVPGQDHTQRVTLDITAPATDAARQWAGWGTALKPAHEPIVVARKPLIGSVASNVLKHGTGALNVDGCRVETMGGENFHRPVNHTGLHEGWDRPWRHDPDALAHERIKRDTAEQKAASLGRWPANVILDEDAGAMLDEQSGISRSAGGRVGNAGGGAVENVPTAAHHKGDPGFGDTGGASRFFYCPKAGRKEREAGLREAGLREPGGTVGDDGGAQHNKNVRMAANHHPTVKPVALMRYLVRLVTPPGGTVLDPFLGSGTTLMAAAFEGFNAIGIEREAEYVEIAKARVAWAERQPVQMSM